MKAYRLRRGAGRTALYIAVIAVSLMYLLPLFWMVRSSLMSAGEIFLIPPVWIPNPPRWSNYTKALTTIPFGRYFLNTMKIVVFNLLGTVLSSSICAFSFARLRWRGREFFFALLMSGMMLPGAVTLIPTFLGWRAVVPPNSYLPLIVPAWFGGGAFNIFLLRQFMRGIPLSLDEAALVDGASYPRIYAQIILPLSKTPLIVVSLFQFLGVWNDFLGPLIRQPRAVLYSGPGTADVHRLLYRTVGASHGRSNYCLSATGHLVPVGSEVLHARHRHFWTQRVIW